MSFKEALRSPKVQGAEDIAVAEAAVAVAQANVEAADTRGLHIRGDVENVRFELAQPGRNPVWFADLRRCGHQD